MQMETLSKEPPVLWQLVKLLTLKAYLNQGVKDELI